MNRTIAKKRKARVRPVFYVTMIKG